jgi:prepilin-type N-terminal cleavage/methylation domain-containing protein
MPNPRDIQFIKNQSSGYTMIEVMIVLAIAALIMVIVFLAIPGLQVSSRNTSREHDASQLVASFIQYEADANNQYFGLPPGEGANFDCSNNTAVSCPFLSYLNFGYYPKPYSDDIYGCWMTPEYTGNTGCDDPSDAFPYSTTPKLMLSNHAVCDSSTATGFDEEYGTAAFYDMVVVYNLEKLGGGITIKCTQFSF